MWKVIFWLTLLYPFTRPGSSWYSLFKRTSCSNERNNGCLYLNIFLIELTWWYFKCICLTFREPVQVVEGVQMWPKGQQPIDEDLGLWQFGQLGLWFGRHQVDSHSSTSLKGTNTHTQANYSFTGVCTDILWLVWMKHHPVKKCVII